MPSPNLQRLWKLNEIDAALVEVRKRAAAMDPGRALMAEIADLEKELEEKGGGAKKIAGELADLELANKGIDDKLKKVDKELYGGLIVSPREVEAFEKEIAMLKRHRGENDEKILALWETSPAASGEAAEVQKRIAAKRAELSNFQKLAMKEKTRLEAQFKELSASRPEATKGLDATLLARYDAIRKKNDGVGMSQISKQSRCGACGMAIAVKTIESVKAGRIETCEACHRLLYYTEGLI